MSATMGTLSGAEMISHSCLQSIVHAAGLFPRLLNLGVEDDLGWAGDAAIFAHTPEVQNHKNGSDDGNADAVPDIGSEQRVGIHNGAPEQSKAHVVVWRHAHLRTEGPFVSKQRRGARHVRANRDGPEAELIVGNR